MPNPDSEIRDSAEWHTIGQLAEKGMAESGESEVKAVIKYQDHD